MPSHVLRIYNRSTTYGPNKSKELKYGITPNKQGPYIIIEHYGKDGKWYRNELWKPTWLDAFRSKYWREIRAQLVDMDDINKWIREAMVAYVVKENRGKPYKGRKKPLSKPKKNEAMETIRARWKRERPDLFKQLKKIRTVLFGGSSVAGERGRQQL